MTADEARDKQAAVVADIRSRGFKEGGKAFTDAQIWQAAVNARSAHPDVVAVELVCNAIDGVPNPSSPTYA
jgi:hypothetical protein